MSKPWMIYGGYGYTGRGTAELAVERGHKPILAGRSAEKLAAVAEKLDLEARPFALPGSLEEGDNDGIAAVHAALDGVAAVVHTAGPFSATSRAMVDACLATGTHYLDVTGEIAVFEAVLARDAEAREAGVVLMPGVGMDVVPTDCLSAMVAAELPDATHLEIAVSGLPAKSPGTAKTMIENLHKPGKARIDGRIIDVPTNWKRKRIPFARGPRVTAAIPWGDVSTAFHTTGIPNITTFMGFPRGELIGMRILPAFRWLVARPSVQAWLKKQAEKSAKPPTPEQRAQNKTDLWASATNASGQAVTASMTVPGGYGFTFDSSIRIVEKILEGAVEPGAWTPARALGAHFAESCDGVTFHGLEKSQGA